MSEPIIAITADKGIPRIQLEQLAEQTGLPLLNKQIQADYLLHISTAYLELRKIIQAGKKGRFASIHVDFVGGKNNHRRLHGGGKGQDLARAIGFNKISNPTVLDLTAGMGGDAFVLATLGAKVTLIERNPVIHALLLDAFQRATLSADAELLAIFSRMRLKHEDAREMLQNLDDKPDVIYIDPMFPVRTKSAQVKKAMQFFHAIVGADSDSESLLLNALTVAKKRIVVKRPRLAEKLTTRVQPACDITGKSTRYDVSLPLSPDASGRAWGLRQHSAKQFIPHMPDEIQRRTPAFFRLGFACYYQFPALSAVLHPVLFVAIISRQKIDFFHLVGLNNVFHHVAGQD